MNVADLRVIETFTLERLKVGLNMPYFTHRLALKTWDEFYDEIIVAIRSEVLADRYQPEQHIVELAVEVPASAWQHIKDEWFPTLSRWFRRPPTTATRRDRRVLHVDHYATFPEAKRVYPDELGSVRMLALSTVEAVK